MIRLKRKATWQQQVAYSLSSLQGLLTKQVLYLQRRSCHRVQTHDLTNYVSEPQVYKIGRLYLFRSLVELLLSPSVQAAS